MAVSSPDATDLGGDGLLHAIRPRLAARHLACPPVLADLIIVHVVDDDQPPRLVEMARRESGALLEELARTIRETDGIACEARVILGNPFQAIVEAAEESKADLVVIGPHRRQILRDAFLGTTAERIIRHSNRPVLMAHGAPVGPYRFVVLAMDFSDCSAAAAQAAKRLGLFERAAIMAVHVLDPPDRSPIIRAAMTVGEYEKRVAEEELRSSKELEALLRKVGVEAPRRVVMPAKEPTAIVVKNCAQTAKADLVVVGTHGRTGIEQWLLGSVAESILNSSDVDVLAVPCRKGD